MSVRAELVRQHDRADRLEVNHRRMPVDAHVVVCIRRAGIGNDTAICAGGKAKIVVVQRNVFRASSVQLWVKQSTELVASG